jgi:polyphosphate kinase 2 (PPK2 family)
MRILPMREMFRLMTAAALALALIGAWGASQPTTAQVVGKQIKLTEKQVEGFIAAIKKLAATKEESEMESIAKQHGFASIEEFDTVEDNVLIVFDGIDPQTKAFVEPPVQIERRIDQASKDKALTEAEKKQILTDLNEELKTAQPLQFPANIELVKRYYDRIVAVLPTR